MTEHIIPHEPPWIVEIDGVSYATPEAVVLLLKAVSEERDTLKKATERLSAEVAKKVADICVDPGAWRETYTEQFVDVLRAYANILEEK